MRGRGRRRSASVLLKNDGTLETNGEQRYYPFGERRITSADLKTDHLFTGQLSVGLGGIYSYGARFYSSKLGRFLSADTIVPDWANPQSLNRYAYTYNNPLKYVDPTGHEACYGTTHNIGTGQGDISQADCWALQATISTIGQTGVDVGGNWTKTDWQNNNEFGYWVFTNSDKSTVIYKLWNEDEDFFTYNAQGASTHIDSFIRAANDYAAAETAIKIGYATGAISGAGLVVSSVALVGSVWATPILAPVVAAEAGGWLLSLAGLAVSTAVIDIAKGSLVDAEQRADINFNALLTNYSSYTVNVPNNPFIPPYPLDQKPPDWTW